MPINVRQTNFLGGEVSPYLWGRTDLPLFGKGLRTMRNFFPSREGAAVSRPGSKYVATAAGPCRLIPFVFSDTDSYALEFSNNLIRFHKAGARVENPAGTPVEVVTTYTAAQMSAIKYAQIGDTLQLTHPEHPPRELRRLDTLDTNASWELVDVEFALPIAYWKNLTTPYAPTHQFAVFGDPMTGLDATHPAREWIWAFTALMQRASDGAIIESFPVFVTQNWDGITEGTIANLADNQAVCYPDYPITLSRPPAAIAPSLPNGWDASDSFTILSYQAYRGRADLMGFVGTTKTDTFKDIGDEPDYSIQPPRGTNPFNITNQAGTITATDRPRAVTFFEQRRVYAGATLRPGFVWFSATGDYFDYDKALIHTADEALEFELASMRRETIRDTIGQDRCIIGTDASIWSAQGSQSGPLSFDSYRFRQEVGIGINSMPFLVVDNGAVLYCRAKGHGVRDLLFDSGRDGLDSRDISNVSAHLFVGLVDGFTHYQTITVGPSTHVEITTEQVQKDLVDWTYAEDPWGVVWAVRTDGKMVSLTYSRAGQFHAWARHDTDGGYLSVCAIPEEEEDGVYIAVYRNIGSTDTQCFIERMTSRVQAGRATDGNALDCAFLYEGAVTDTITGLDHLEGEQVWVTGPGLPIYGEEAPLTVTGGSITLPETPEANTLPNGWNDVGATTGHTSDDFSSLTLYVGLKFTADLETLDLAQSEVRGKMKNVVRAFFEVDNSRGLQVGESFDDLKEWEARDVSDSYSGAAFRTELVEMLVASSWNQGGRAVLRQESPIATTVVAFQREVEVGG